MKGIIYGKTFKSAEQKMSDVLDEYERAKIPVATLQHSHCQETVIFENGDYWLAIGASDNCRGKACNIAYIDKDIDSNIISYVIMPTIKAAPFQGWKFY